MQHCTTPSMSRYLVEQVKPTENLQKMRLREKCIRRQNVFQKLLLCVAFSVHILHIVTMPLYADKNMFCFIFPFSIIVLFYFQYTVFEKKKSVCVVRNWKRRENYCFYTDEYEMFLYKPSSSSVKKHFPLMQNGIQ